MSPFLTPLRCEYVTPWTFGQNGWERNDGTDRWQLTEPFQVYSKTLKKTVVCDTGFRFDKASVPTLPLMFAEFGGRFTRAACVHDKLCRERRYKREKIDLVFLELMRAEIDEELDAMREAGIDTDEIVEQHARLEGRAQMMYSAVALYTKSGLWKGDADKPGFEVVA